MQNVTYDVRVYETEKRMTPKGKVTSYRVLWKVDGVLFRESFKKSAQADGFRSDLVSAARKGESFDRDTGRPVAWQRATNRMSWYDFAVAFADRKWKDASAKHRADIARVLMLATMAMFSSHRGKPDEKQLRRALCRWAYNTKQRENAPENVAVALKWAAQNTLNVDVLADP